MKELANAIALFFFNITYTISFGRDYYLKPLYNDILMMQLNNV